LKPENLLLKYKPTHSFLNSGSQNSSNHVRQPSNNKSIPNGSSIPTAPKTNNTNTIDVKIIDFGLSKLLESDDTVASTFLGTRGYLAPEMLQRREYTRAVDTWAVGVIVFVLLCGCLPFDDDSATMPQDLYVVQKRFILRFPRWAKNLSASAKDLLNHLLDINPTTRFTAEQALNHEWVQGQTAQAKNYLSSPGRIRKSPAASTCRKTTTSNGVNIHTSNYLGRKYAPDLTCLTPPQPRVRKGSV
jgi:serine/threonine protein kinase